MRRPARPRRTPRSPPRAAGRACARGRARPAASSWCRSRSLLSAVVGRFSHEALGFKPRHSPTIHCCIGYIGVSFVRILHGGTVSTLLYSLGRWSYRHPWRVLVGWLLLLAIA